MLLSKMSQLIYLTSTLLLRCQTQPPVASYAGRNVSYLVALNTYLACEPAIFYWFRDHIPAQSLRISRTPGENVEAIWARFWSHYIIADVRSKDVVQLSPNTFSFSCEFREWRAIVRNPFEGNTDTFRMVCPREEHPPRRQLYGRVEYGVGLCDVVHNTEPVRQPQVITTDPGSSSQSREELIIAILTSSNLELGHAAKAA